MFLRSQYQISTINLVLLIAIYLMISLFSLYFRTNTHLYLTDFTPLGVWTIGLKTSRFINGFNYSCIDSFHFGQSFLFWHSSTFVVRDPHHFL